MEHANMLFSSIQISSNVASKLKKVCHIITKSSYVYMKLGTIQLSLSAKSVVVIYSIVHGYLALMQWYDYVCHCLQKPYFEH